VPATATVLPEQFAILRGKTAPQLIAERARSEPAAVAFRSKRRGLYREWSWLDYAKLVGQCALALRNQGIERGARVAIMGDACEEWVICDQAAQALGAITFGIYPTASVSEVAYQMKDSGATVFIAEDQEYVDKILKVADGLPDLRSIVVIDDSAMFGYTDRRIARLHDILAGAPPAEEGLPALNELVRQLSPPDPAFIVYTSGTTGNPKGALISHGKHLAGVYTFVDLHPTLVQKQHRTVVFLPLCHIFGRDLAITLPLISRLVPHYGEDIDDLPRTLFEVAPTVLFTVPRYMQKFASQIVIGLGNTSFLKCWASAIAMRAARGVARRRWSGSRGVADPMIELLARTCVFSPMLSKVGLDKCELVISGGAPLPPETAALWQIWGVNLVEAYGQTETGGAIISGQPGPFPKPGNVGVVARGWEAKLGQGGELLVRGPDAFEGYWGKPDATAEVVDAEGFMHTGDVAEWQGSNLRLIDRARDFLVTAGGKTISPSMIENILRGSAYIAEAVVIGHARKYLTALIEIDQDVVADWARANDIPYTGFASLVCHARVEALIRSEIDKANNELTRVEQVKSFRILPKQLDPEEEGEPVTPTRKVKRALMQSRFKVLIEEMYEDREERLVAAAAGEVLAPS
jgi:long-chain acyl-CoA synthetase